jgi:MFS family permease
MHSSGNKEEHGHHTLNIENVEDGQPKEIFDLTETDSRTKSSAEKALIRKLDWIVLPMLWLMYFLNFLDRAAITVARLNKMEKDLHLTSTQYQACVSGLFVGYLLGQVPSSKSPSKCLSVSTDNPFDMIITRVRPSIFLGAWMALWAICSTLQGIVHNFTGLFLARFFLGFTEAPFYPGALYLLSIFYTRREIATRISILFSGSVCGNAFASLIAIGVFKMHGTAGLEGWRWLYILQGIVTFFVAIISMFILPDEPSNTRWLTPDERELAQTRVSVDTVAIRVNTSTLAGLKDAVTDMRLWPLIIIQHLGVAASGYKNFLPTVVQSLGYSQTKTLGMTCPPYLVSGALSVLLSWSSGESRTTYAYLMTTLTLSIGRFNERTWQ